MEFVSPEGLRIDGRRPKELRRLDAQLDVLSSADGSAIYSMGNTKASVIGCESESSAGRGSCAHAHVDGAMHRSELPAIDG